MIGVLPVPTSSRQRCSAPTHFMSGQVRSPSSFAAAAPAVRSTHLHRFLWESGGAERLSAARGRALLDGAAPVCGFCSRR